MKKIIHFNLLQFIILFSGAIIMRAASIAVLYHLQTPAFVDLIRGCFYDLALVIFIILISDILILLFSLLKIRFLAIFAFSTSSFLSIAILICNFLAFLYTKYMLRLILPQHLAFLFDKQFFSSSLGMLVDLPYILLLIILPLLTGLLLYLKIKKIQLTRLANILYFPSIIILLIISLSVTSFLRKKIFVKNVFNSHYLYALRDYAKEKNRAAQFLTPDAQIYREAKKARELIADMNLKDKDFLLEQYPLVRSPWGTTNHPFIRAEANPGQDYYMIRQKLGSDDGIIKPNIIIFLLEAFRAVDIGAYGSDLGLTPVFDDLSKKGIFFTDFWNAGKFTRRGIEAVLCSIASSPEDNTVLRNYPKTTLVTLPEILKKLGYKTYWFYSGDANFDNQTLFCQLHKFDYICDAVIFSKNTPKNTWGYSEKELMRKSIEMLNKNKGPFFAVIQTVAIHEPFAMPEDAKRLHKRTYDAELEPLSDLFYYTDEALGLFFKEANKTEWYNKTIIAITADESGHRIKLDNKPLIMGYKWLTIAHKIPLLILGPGLKPRIIDRLGYQPDIAPTILGLIGCGYLSQFMGEDLLSKTFSTERKFVISNYKSPDWILTKNYFLTVNEGEKAPKLYQKISGPKGEIDLSTQYPAVSKGLLDHYNIWLNSYGLFLRYNLFFPTGAYQNYH